MGLFYFLNKVEIWFGLIVIFDYERVEGGVLSFGFGVGFGD